MRAEFDKVPDRIVMAFGDDTIQSGKLATLPFVSRISTDVLGYWLPPYFKFLYVDTWLDDIYAKIGRRVYVPEAVIEHQHFSTDSSRWDQTYQDPRVPGAHARGKLQWELTAGERELDAQLLAKYIRDQAQNG